MCILSIGLIDLKTNKILKKDSFQGLFRVCSLVHKVNFHQFKNNLISNIKKAQTYILVNLAFLISEL